jgi:hypothetical protein
MVEGIVIGRRGEDAVNGVRGGFEGSEENGVGGVVGCGELGEFRRGSYCKG